jgi:hypothetical protein
VKNRIEKRRTTKKKKRSKEKRLLLRESKETMFCELGFFFGGKDRKGF